MALSLPLKGRGTADNPVGRFEPLRYEPDPEAHDSDAPGPRTQVFLDSSRSILAHNDSPDVAFGHSVNPYRGCEHGCAYCYARPYHEYLGLSAGLDFETKILAKPDAPKLLRQELMRPAWRGELIGFSGVTDCYQPLERSLRLTRGCLEVAAEFRQPVVIVTKNRLVCRDLDVLGELNRFQAAAVWISLTTLEEELCRRLEPRASAPAARLAAIRELTAAGIPVGTLVAPIIPGLNEHEIPAILEAVREAGACHAGYVMLRLPHGLKELFADWLERNYPERKERVLGRVRSVRGGKLNAAAFKERMKGTGEWAGFIEQVFKLHRRRLGFSEQRPMPSSASFRRPGDRQGDLFSG